MKLVAVLLCWAMVFSGTGMTVFAEEETAEAETVEEVTSEAELEAVPEETAETEEVVDEKLTSQKPFTVSVIYDPDGEHQERDAFNSIDEVFQFINGTLNKEDNTVDVVVTINDPEQDVTVDANVVKKLTQNSDNSGRHNRDNISSLTFKCENAYKGNLVFDGLTDVGYDGFLSVDDMTGLNITLDLNNTNAVQFKNCYLRRNLVLKNSKVKFVRTDAEEWYTPATGISALHVSGDTELNVQDCLLSVDFLYCEDGKMPKLSISEGTAYGVFGFLNVYLKCQDQEEPNNNEQKYPITIEDDFDLSGFEGNGNRILQIDYVYKCSPDLSVQNHCNAEIDDEVFEISYTSTNDPKRILLIEKQMVSGIINGERVETCSLSGTTIVPDIVMIDYDRSIHTSADNLLISDETGIDLYNSAKVYVANPRAITGRERLTSGYELEFSSDKPGIAFVDENGILRAKTIGSATITVSAKDNPAVKRLIKVRVVNPVESVSLTVDNNRTEVPRISKTKFTAKVSPETNVNQQVNWSVYAKRAGEEDFTQVTDDLAGVKTVSTKGAVTVGELTVNAAKEDVGNLELKVRATSASNYNEDDQEISDEKTVTLTDSKPVTKVTLTPVASTVEAYSETLIKATVLPAGDNVDRKLTWTVTDKDKNDLLEDAENGIDLAVAPDSQSAKLIVNLLGKTPIDQVIITATSVSDSEVAGSTTIKINPEKKPTALSFTPAATQTCYGDEVSLTLKPDVIGAYPGVTVSVWKGVQKVTDGINVKVSGISADSSLKITDPKRSTVTITFKTYHYIADEGEQEYTIKAESTVYDLSAEAKVTVKNRYELSDTPGFTLDAGDTKTLKIYDNKQKKYVNATSWKSSDPQVASVSSTGLVKALKGGMAVIQPMMGDDELATECYTPINTTVTVNAVVGAPSAAVQGGKTAVSKGDKILLSAPEGSIHYLVNPEENLFATEMTYDGPIVVDDDMLAHTRYGLIIIRAWAVNDGIESEKKSFFFATERETAESSWGDVNAADQARFGDEASVPNELWMSKVEDQVYTGTAIKPAVRVYDHKKLLKNGTDYTITYKNNTKSYTAVAGDKKSPVVTVTFKNNYSGTLEQLFTINKASIDDAVAADLYSVVNGSVQKPVPVVTWNGKALKNKTDFTVSYPDDSDGAYKVQGEWTIRIEGENDFKGTKDINLHLNDTNVHMTSCTVANIKPVTYNGEEQKPAVSVKYGGKIVDPGKYDVAYQYNTDAGQATVVISAKEGSGFIGDVSKQFTIKPASISGATVVINDPLAGGKYTYDGEAIEPEVTVTLKNGTKLDSDETDANGDVTVEHDYEVVYSKNNVAGTATAQVIAKGNYTGSASVKFKIEAFDMTADSQKDEAERKITIGFRNNVSEVSYNASGSNPDVMVLYDGENLYEGEDYTIKFSNNKAVGDKNDPNLKKRPTFTITGKGGFKGKITGYYTIVRTNIDSATMYVNDVVYKNKKNNYKTTVKLVDANGKALSAGKDYDKELFYFYHEDGEGHQAGEAVGKDAIVQQGTTLRVKVLGMKNYKGAKTCLFRVGKTSLSSAKCKIEDQDYTGRSISLDAEDLAGLKVGSTPLTLDVDYEIIGYEKNINAGTATVIIRGKGDYVGDKKLTFKIVKKPVPKPQP